MNLPDVYESSDLTVAIGVSPMFLNKLVERGLHGIKPSLRADVRTGGRRWFSKEDVFGVALVYWLFEAGLRAGSGKVRTSVIQDVLDQIAQKRNATASDAAKRLYETDTAVLVIIQPLYPEAKGKNRRKLYVRLMTEEDPFAADPYDVEIYIPVGNLLTRLDDFITRRT